MLVELAKTLSGEVQLSSRLGQWILAASSQLDGVARVDVKYPQIRLPDPTDVARYPTLVSGGPSEGWAFAVGNWVYAESPFLPNRDPERPLIIGIGWVPVGNEPTKKVKWQGDFGIESEGTNVDVIDLTETVEDEQLVANAIYKRSAITLTAAQIKAFPGADEVHIRLQRIASTDDPVFPPALHHIAVIQALL